MLTGAQFANEIGVVSSTLLSYERKGILKPAKVSPTGRKFYSQEQLQAFLDQDYKNPVLTGRPRE